MPDTFTPALNLTKPEVGASRDSWGSKTNLNWDTLDQFVSQAMPIGSILDLPVQRRRVAGSFVPKV